MFNWLKNVVESYYDAKLGTTRNELIMLYLTNMNKTKENTSNLESTKSICKDIECEK